jgi:adenylate cyclase
MTHRLGVRGRLLIAFFGISAFSVLAAVAAVYSFLAIGAVLERITQQRVPSALGALEISREAERIVAAAPALLAVSNGFQREGLMASINAEVEHLNQLVTNLKSNEIDASALEAIELAARRLGENLTALDTLVSNRLAASMHKNAILGNLSTTNRGAQRVLMPGISVMDAKLSQLRRAIDDPQLSDEERSAAMSDLTRKISAALPLQKFQVEVSAITDLLVRAASEKTRADVELLSFPLRKSLSQLNLLIGDLPAIQRKFLAPRIEKFDELANGPNSILEARGKELDLIASGEELILQNIDLSRQLTQAVDELLMHARADIATGNLEAGSVQRVSTLIMIAVVALSLISSSLIVWLYVGRNLIARLTALSDSMLAIAGGNLRADLPASGSDEIGRMVEALTVFRDTAIEVEKSNLREVEEARRRLTAAIEAISEGFSLYDAEDRLVLCNSTYRALLYPGIEDIVTPGARFTTIIRRAAEIGLIEDAKDRIDDWIEERLDRHHNPTGPHIQRRGDGRWVQVNELKTEDGGTVAVYSDITELKKREAELEEMDRLKSNFLSSVSHELRTPLTSVRGFAKLISRDFARRFMPLVGDDAKLQKQANRIGDNLAIIVGEAERLTRLINDVLDISKIESGSTDWREEDIDVAGLVSQAFSAASGQFSDKPTVEARLTIDDDLPALMADRDRLVQVLVNLLNNAAKFTDEGTVELKAGTTEDGWLRFSVSDTGAGIPPEEQEMVFDKFHQVTKSDTLEDKPKGTGLGLTICKQIIEYHGGRIWVESETDIGSEFIFILPPAGQNTLRAETLDENA